MRTDTFVIIVLLTKTDDNLPTTTTRPSNDDDDLETTTTFQYCPQAAKLAAPTKLQMKKAGDKLSQLMMAKPFARMPYENEFE